jgi:site-specific recombinase XerD
MSGLSYETVAEIVKGHYKYNNFSVNSLKTVLKTLKWFDDYMKARGLTDFRDITIEDYYSFLDEREKTALERFEKPKATGIKNITKQTLNDYGYHMRKVFSILEEEEKIMLSPFNGVELVKRRHNIRDKIFSESEMIAILESIDPEGPAMKDGRRSRGAQWGVPIAFRDRTVLETLYGTGIRASELCNLNLPDFIAEEKMIFVRQGKGKKDRIVPLGSKVFDYISRYIKKIRPAYVNRHNRNQAMFLTERGGRISNKTLFSIFLKIRRQYSKTNPELDNVDLKKFCPHAVRHTFATHLIQAGADIREVQLLLGHASIQATEIYLNLSTTHLKEVYGKYHPLENELFFDVKSRESYLFDLLEKAKRKSLKYMFQAAHPESPF